jgi:hypothetical protein
VIFLYFQSKYITIKAIKVVGMSINDFLPRMTTAPEIAPIAEAVTPSTNALMAGRFPYYLKYGAGKIVNK